MSTVKANNVQVGQSGTATNNFTLYQPSTPDGTVRLAVGNSGATTGDVLSVSNTGLSVTGTLSATGNVTLSGGTANGVLYLNGSKVATSGSALTFNGSRFTVQSSTPAATPTWTAVDTAVFSQTSNSIVQLHAGASGGTLGLGFSTASTRNAGLISFDTGTPSFIFSLSGSEAMRLTSTGLGIGTTSPSSILDVQKAGTAASTTDLLELTNSGNAASMTNTGTGILFNQFYYDATTPAVADAGRIAVKTEGNWTSTASTQDAYMTFETALDGTVAERARITSGGDLLVGGTTAYGQISATKSIAPAATPSSDWGIDFASSTAPPNYISLAASATYDLAAGSGFVILHNNNGDAAAFLTYGGSVTKLGGATNVISGTAGANQIGLAYNSGTGKYRISNGHSSTQNIFVTTIRTRTSS